MASALYILDTNGVPLICRSYRGDILQDVSAVFQRRVIEEEESRVTPIFNEHGTTYTFIRHNNVYILMVSNINSCPLLQVTFMRRCVTVFESYFKSVTEETVRDNFVIIYELLDEMADFGFPQYTEEKILKEYITQESLIALLLPDDKLNVKALPAAVTGRGGATPWRLPGKYKYSRNEILIDVVERVSLLVSQDNETLSSDIKGTVSVNVRLSGMPSVCMGVNDKLFFDLAGRSCANAVDIEDVKFHQCVKLNQFESERTISFIPPDGKFELLTYRLSKKIAPPVVVFCNVTRFGTSRVQIKCSARTTYRRNIVANSLEIIIPIPSDADLPSSSCTQGVFRYNPEMSLLLWSLKNVAGKHEFSCQAQFHLPSVRSSDVSALAKAPIQVNFEIPYFVPSGFQVRYVKITEKSNYDALPWVRYVTQSGDYQIRTN